MNLKTSQQHLVFFSINVQLSRFRYGSRWRELDLNRAVKAQSKQNEDRSQKVEGVGKVVPIM